MTDEAGAIYHALTREASIGVLGFLDGFPSAARDIEDQKLKVGDEIFLATIIAALGFEVVPLPFFHSVRWRKKWKLKKVEKLLATNECVWIHPIKRNYDDERRAAIRQMAASLS